MNLLARREHSFKELDQKLVKRFDDAELRSKVIADLAEDGLQSDERFAASYSRWRAGKGFGPLRIRQELQQRGVAEEIVKRSLYQSEIDWFQVLFDQFNKKFGAVAPSTLDEKAKCQRFLSYRGFSHDLIRSLFAELA